MFKSFECQPNRCFLEAPSMASASSLATSKLLLFQTLFLLKLCSIIPGASAIACFWACLSAEPKSWRFESIGFFIPSSFSDNVYFLHLKTSFSHRLLPIERVKREVDWVEKSLRHEVGRSGSKCHKSKSWIKFQFSRRRRRNQSYVKDVWLSGRNRSLTGNRKGL